MSFKTNSKHLQSSNLQKLNGNIYSRFPYKNEPDVEIIFVKTIKIDGKIMTVGNFNKSCINLKHNVKCWTFVTKSSEMKRIFKTLSDLKDPTLIQKRLKEILGLHQDWGTYNFVYVGIVNGENMISPLNYGENNNNNVSKTIVRSLVKSSWNKNDINKSGIRIRSRRIKFTGKGYTYDLGAEKYTKNNTIKQKRPKYFGVKEYVLKPGTVISNLSRHTLSDYIKQMKQNTTIKSLPGYITNYFIVHNPQNKKTHVKKLKLKENI